MAEKIVRKTRTYGKTEESAVKESKPVLKKTSDLYKDMDTLAEPVIFISSRANHTVKIPPLIMGEYGIPLPGCAEFDGKHKYECRSKHIASVLRDKKDVIELIRD